MKYLIILCLLFSGCSFIYDSRGENALDLSNPKYKGVSADKAKVKTGRYIEANMFLFKTIKNVY
jgi:hypothetical protein